MSDAGDLIREARRIYAEHPAHPPWNAMPHEFDGECMASAMGRACRLLGWEHLLPRDQPPTPRQIAYEAVRAECDREGQDMLSFTQRHTTYGVLEAFDNAARTADR